ncbi:MAG: SEC-C metal-binding domain-containing protein [Casimicrobiaceae bacterium]
MANKARRNDPCPCGSGRKYKHCCLPKDQAAQSTALAASATLATAEQRAIDAMLERDDPLAAASNAVIDLIKAGELEQAEQAAWNLLGAFPDVHDGFDRLGMVYQARGQNKQAADFYRQVIDFVRTHPQQYDPDFTTTFRNLIQELDPPAAG